MSDKIARCNEWMFRFVRCKAYMKKVNDGRFIEMLPGSDTPDGTEAYYYVDANRMTEDHEPWMQEIVEFCGDLEFIKTYYQHTEKQFVGIVVGMKMLTVSAYLYVETNYGYDGSERTMICKQTKEQMKCALVYYGCNKSRFVPMTDLEIMEDE